IAGERYGCALGPPLEAEWPGTDWLLLVRFSAFRRHDDRVTPAQIVEERALRLLQGYLDGLGIDCLDCLDGGEQDLLRIDRIFGHRALQRKLHVLRVKRGAVM